jgi:polyphosphate kinase
VTPVTARSLRARLDEILETNLADDVLAWELHADGAWEKIQTEVGIDTHRRLCELAESRARDGRPADARA